MLGSVHLINAHIEKGFLYHQYMYMVEQNKLTRLFNKSGLFFIYFIFKGISIPMELMICCSL